MSAFAAFCALAGLAAVGAVTVVHLLARLSVHLWRIYGERKKAKRPPKSRIVDLWHVGPVRYWLFEDGEHPSVDPETGETLMNGWTHEELTEVARRPSEWL